MNKKNYFVSLVTIAFCFLILGSMHAEAASFPFPLPLSPSIDKVRDTQGNPLQKDANYKIKVFSTSIFNTTAYYFYDDYRGSAYDWIWLTTSSSKAIPFQINSNPETDGREIHIIKGPRGSGELVRFQNDGTYAHGGLYWGKSGHSDRYGFRRIEGDRDYKYLLISNYGGIFANFSDWTITTLNTDDYFLISFVKVGL